MVQDAFVNYASVRDVEGESAWPLTDSNLHYGMESGGPWATWHGLWPSFFSDGFGLYKRLVTFVKG